MSLDRVRLCMTLLVEILFEIRERKGLKLSFYQLNQIETQICSSCLLISVWPSIKSVSIGYPVDMSNQRLAVMLNLIFLGLGSCNFSIKVVVNQLLICTTSDLSRV